MHRTTGFAIGITLIILALSAFWASRVRAASVAAQFAPATMSVLIPADTVIDVLIANGITSSSVEGDTVQALVSGPVVVEGRLVIPDGAQLDGNLERVSVDAKNVKATIAFTVLTADGRSFPIQTQPLVVILPIRGDTEILFGALKALTGSGIGTSIGAPSEDGRVIERGLLAGTGLSLPANLAVPAKVILMRDLKMGRESSESPVPEEGSGDPKKETVN